MHPTDRQRYCGYCGRQLPLNDQPPCCEPGGRITRDLDGLLGEFGLKVTNPLTPGGATRGDHQSLRGPAQL